MLVGGRIHTAPLTQDVCNICLACTYPYGSTVMAMDAVLKRAKAINEPLGVEKFMDPTTFCARSV